MINTEIRIGNLIKRNGLVVTVDEQTFWDMKKYPEKYEPIKLTEEWLFKFGFKKEECDATGISIWDEFYINDFIVGNHGTNMTPFHFTAGNGIVKYILYVHTLQNLYFYLTGQELTYLEQL